MVNLKEAKQTGGRVWRVPKGRLRVTYAADAAVAGAKEMSSDAAASAFLTSEYDDIGGPSTGDLRPWT